MNNKKNFNFWFLIKEYKNIIYIYFVNLIICICLTLFYKDGFLFWFSNTFFSKDINFYFLSFMDIVFIIIYMLFIMLLPFVFFFFFYINYIFFINAIEFKNFYLFFYFILTILLSQLLCHLLLNKWFYFLIIKTLTLNEINSLSLNINLIILMPKYMYLYLLITFFSFLLDFMLLFYNTWRSRISSLNFNRVYFYVIVYVIISVLLPPDILMHIYFFLFLLFNLEYRILIINFFNLLKTKTKTNF